MNIKDFFENFLGVKVNISEWEGRKALPLYLSKNHDFTLATVCGGEFLLADITNDEEINIKKIRAYKAKLEGASGFPVVFIIDDIGRVERDALISVRLEFISPPDQVYMPSIGVMLKDKRSNRAKYIETEKFTPSAQILYLFLQYDEQREYSKGEISKALSMPTATMTRVSAYLESIGLLSSRKSGREILIKASSSGFKFYQKAKPYLINPVMKSYFVKAKKNCGGIPAGEYVVAQRSDLASPSYRTFAYDRKDDRIRLDSHVDNRWADETDLMKVEIWRYNPSLFVMDDGGADPISIACSLSEIYDERLEYANEKMIKECL